MDYKEVNGNQYTATTGTSNTKTYSYDIRTPIQKTLDDLRGYLESIDNLKSDNARLSKIILELEARIKALEERPPTYVPYPVYPVTYPTGPYWRFDNDSKTYVYTEPTTGTGGNP